MELIQILEYIEGKNLSKWNSLQKELWAHLVELGKVKKNDASLFLKFGEYFDKFYRVNNRAPTCEEVIKGLNI